MNHSKMTASEFEYLMNLGKAIQEIHFSDMPDEAVLVALCENSDTIQIHLPLTKHFCLGVYHNSFFNKHIISAHLETDVFIDSSYLFEYPNLKHLVLTCLNSEVEELDVTDLGDMWFAVSELKQLETLRFDVRQMKQQVVEQIKDQFHFPDRSISVEFVDRKKSRIKRIQSK